MKKFLANITFVLIGLSIFACAGKEATVTNNWLSFDDYSIEIDSDEDQTNVQVLPSIWVTPADTVFTNDLILNLHYPSSEERIDLALIDIFSKNPPQAELPDIKVVVSYMFTEEEIEEQSFDNPLFEETEWTELDTYALKPGGDKKVKIKKAAYHSTVVIKTELYDEEGKELFVRYLNGIELE